MLSDQLEAAGRHRKHLLPSGNERYEVQRHKDGGDKHR